MWLYWVPKNQQLNIIMLCPIQGCCPRDVSDLKEPIIKFLRSCWSGFSILFKLICILQLINKKDYQVSNFVVFTTCYRIPKGTIKLIVTKQNKIKNWIIVEWMIELKSHIQKIENYLKNLIDLKKMSVTLQDSTNNLIQF